MDNSNVFANFDGYQELFKKFEPSVIENRYLSLLEKYKNFIKEQNFTNDILINTQSLKYAVLDYFSDIGRLKEYHNIEHTNHIKVMAYESYWLWRRRPLQIINKGSSNSELPFCNELFIYTDIISFLMGDCSDKTDSFWNEANENDDIRSFFVTLYYHLKFRHCNAQMFELMMYAFKAGHQFNGSLSID